MKPAAPTSQQPREKSKPKRKLCPYVRSPGKDCYCLDMNSNKISMTIYYCQNHYKNCEIYKKIIKQKKDKPDEIEEL